MARRYRSITHGRTERYNIKVWRNEVSFPHAASKDVHEVLGHCFEAITMLEILERLEPLPRITQIEILDRHCHGADVQIDTD